MTKQLITIANNRRVSIPAYINGVRLAKANPDRIFSYGLTSWWSTSGRDIYQQYIDGLHDRINQAQKNRNVWQNK